MREQLAMNSHKNISYLHVGYASCLRSQWKLGLESSYGSAHENASGREGLAEG